MTTRRSDAGHRSGSTADGLIAELEAGSTVAEARLAAVVTEERSSGDDGHSETLDLVAASAAGGSPYALGLLLELMVEHRLAGPAIGRIVSDPPVVEDISQEVLVAVANSIHRFRGDARFTTWLYTLARNTAVSHLRRVRPTTELAIDDRFHDGAPRRLSSLVTERDVVFEAIHALPDTFRDTVMLRDIEGLSYAEIAERHGVELNTVRSRLSRGRALLARRLA